ncbi:MAG: hemolysin [Bacteroidetes bacterium GWF2_38_335]|nr:MAG: hemolysin [Bacteroidetes bacterium GWF2_38_335]OFY78309.1 MAG: hemolysin [Bacteroidetes bacterium RIFOXYA12_FULL_38_20]HBS87495.1 hemolysin [Bacteroidales bacterium]
MDYIIIVITLIFSAFFSGMEIAFLSANKLRIELDKNHGEFTSKIISIFVKNPARYIATLLFGNNIALVVYGLFMAIVLTPLVMKITDSNAWILVLQTLISTIVIVITGEYLPKTIFRINPNLSLKIFALPVLFFYYLFYPISSFTIWFSNTFLKAITKGKYVSNPSKLVFGKVDLNFLVSEAQESQGEDDSIENELKIFQNALDFSNIKVRECMIPRTEIIALDVNETVEKLRNKFIKTGLTKILIFKDSIDNIIGYVHSSELFKNPKSIRNMMIELAIVPESMPASKLLTLFIQSQKSVALVVDEFGGTSGMVTIEDIVEEIIGEIEDEFDVPDLEEKDLGDGCYIFAGRLEIDYLNEKYDLNLPESEEYETLAGLILFNTESIPQVNETIEIEGFTFKIEKVSETRIEKITLIKAG